MKRYLLDSNTLTHFVSGRYGVHEKAREVRSQGASIGTAVPIYTEFLAGIHYSDSADTNLPIAKRKLKELTLWPFDLEAALTYASLYADLRRKGVNLQVLDLMAAAVAKTLPRCVVVTTDSDFSRVPGLSVENWAS